MATTEREVLLRGGNTDGEVDNNFEALAGAGFFKKSIFHEGTLDLGSAAANDAADSFASADVTVPGVGLGDMVLGVSLGVDTVDTTVTAKVTAADTVTVTVHNGTTDAVNLASTTVRLWVLTLR